MSDSPLVLLAFPAAALLLSAGLLAHALRGRRVDDHPICRRCGFDLVGKPADVTRCSECGADLARKNAVRDGHRARRYGLIAVAAPALLLCGGWLGFIAWASARGVNLNPRKPTWWLVQEAGSAGAVTRDAAMAELLDRLGKGRLSAPQVRDVAERVLAYQTQRDLAWGPPWDQFLERARDDHLLGDEQWSRYARQAVVLEAGAAEGGAAGEKLRVMIRSQFRDGGGGRFLVRVWWTTPCLIDNHPGPKGLAHEPILVHYGRGGRGDGLTVPLPKHLRQRPSGRPPSIVVPAEVEVYEVDSREAQRINWRTTHPDPKLLRARFMTSLAATWHAPPAVRVSNVTLRGVETWTPQWAVTVGVNRPPLNVAMKVVLRTRDADGPLDQELGTLTCAAGQTVSREVSRGNVLAPKARRVDVILKPSAEAAAAAFGTAWTWDGEVVFKDLPVNVLPKAPQRP